MRQWQCNCTQRAEIQFLSNSGFHYIQMKQAELLSSQRTGLIWSHCLILCHWNKQLCVPLENGNQSTYTTPKVPKDLGYRYHTTKTLPLQTQQSYEMAILRLILDLTPWILLSEIKMSKEKQFNEMWEVFVMWETRPKQSQAIYLHIMQRPIPCKMYWCSTQFKSKASLRLRLFCMMKYMYQYKQKGWKHFGFVTKINFFLLSLI